MKLVLFIFFLGYSLTQANAQRPIKELTINSEIYPILKSQYGKIEVVDNRKNKNLVIDLDSLDHYHLKTNFSLQPELNIQVQDFYNEHIGSIAQHINKKVLFVIHEYNIYRDYKSNISKLFFSMQGDLFLQDGKKYKLLKSLDTIVVYKELNIKSFFAGNSQIIFNFLLREAENKLISSESYELEGALDLDSLCKRESKLYNSNNLTSGFYYTFKNLSELNPNFKINVPQETSLSPNLNEIFYNNEFDLPLDSVFAVIAKNKLYIRLNHKFIEAKKVKNEFQLNSDMYISVYPQNPLLKNTLGSYTSTLAFGLVGGILWNELVETKNVSRIFGVLNLNCRTGQLRFVRQTDKSIKDSNSR
jgi:hypothetical protein